MADHAEDVDAGDGEGTAPVIFGRKKDERTVANQDGSAILNELVKVLQKDAEFPDDEWVSFALIGWLRRRPCTRGRVLVRPSW